MEQSDIYLYRNDQWTLHDHLGIAAIGDQVARMALEVEPPFTLGVTGKWGSGKTSVMRRAFATLGGHPISQALPLGVDRQEFDTDTDDNADNLWKNLSYENRESILQWEKHLQQRAAQSLSIWYSPWQHQHADNPLIPLLLEIREQFDTWTRIKQKASEINRRGGIAGLALLTGAIDAAMSLVAGRPVKFAQDTTANIRKSIQETESKLTSLSDGQRFHLLFEDAIENVLQSLCKDDEAPDEQARLIVFIDDLDRCEESMVISLLESIKLYLGSRRCVFVFGIDDTAVLNALKRHWKERSDEDNREYLEKLFQAMLSVPVPDQRNIRQVIAEQLKAHGYPAADKRAGEVENLLEPNPRKIKNFVNSLCATWCLLSANRKRLDGRRLMLFHYLRLYHRPVWRLLERQPWALQLLHRVIQDSNEPIQKLPKQKSFDEEEQRIMKELMSRSFSHVLKHVETDADAALRHRTMSLDQAVELFEQRLDRKRSDEQFVVIFRDLIDKDEVLNKAFLHLSEVDIDTNE